MSSPVSVSTSEYRGCPGIVPIIDRIGDKWTVMVVGALAKGLLRFNAIMRAIEGISHRMLTLTLRGLERDGLVTRTAFPTIPPRVDYELTTLGKSLIDPLLALGRWAVDNGAAMQLARFQYDSLNQAVDTNALSRKP